MVPLDKLGTLDLQHCISILYPLFHSISPYERKTIPEFEYAKIKSECRAYVDDYLQEKDVVNKIKEFIGLGDSKKTEKKKKTTSNN